MLILANFDVSFEQKVMIVCTILFVAFLSLMALRWWPSTTMMADDNGSVLEDQSRYTESGTAIIPGKQAEVLLVDDLPDSSMSSDDLPVLRRMRYEERPSRPKTAEADRQCLRREAYNSFQPTNDAERELQSTLEKIAKGRQGSFDLHLQTVLPQIGPGAQKTLRDLLALAGEIDLFLQLLALRPELKDKEFCTKMSPVYQHLLTDLEGVWAPETKALWKKFQSALQ